MLRRVFGALNAYQANHNDPHTNYVFQTVQSDILQIKKNIYTIINFATHAL